MRRSYLGKIHLHWCDACHTPVLGPKCECGAGTRAVHITPPGDARPAFPADVDLINAIYEEHFGSRLIPEGHLVVLNKVPDRDRMEEVILGGAVVSAVRYLPEERCWEPIPRVAASQYLEPKRRYVVVDDGAVESIRDGASVLAPGLVDIDPAVKAGDEVFIRTRNGDCIGVGRAKADAETARAMERGTVVRTRKNHTDPCIPGPASWDDACRTNSTILDNNEAEAVAFVRNVAEQNRVQPTVSYSGGKDSLAMLLVVRKAIGDVPLLFADTGLEFAETYENIDGVADRYGLDVVRVGPDGGFWESFETEGPPAVDARWCCKVCKLLPVRRLIEEQWGECLSFIGQRKYESFARMKSPRVWRNGIVKVQISAAPIQHWTALHVWLYIFRENAPYNTLYEQRIDRIGCFMCPSSDLSVLATIQERYPALWKGWEEKLEAWRTHNGLPPDWIDDGNWRRRGEGTDENSSYT
ncbi:MAG: phosphoadenosine phosphosulfate reductase family protein [Methanomicrobiaceae archaeon]|nr:phosphoadenosine phosphosulfate reductase family protein [Methanomicrobiaceae archaeon]